MSHPALHTKRRTRFSLVVGLLAVFAVPGCARRNPETERDAVRVRDLETIRAALERFRRERGQYPPIEPPERTLRGASDGCVSVILGSLVPGILAKIPEDPLRAGGDTQPQAERRCYYYRKGPGMDTYALYARFEGDNSPKPCSKALLYRPEIALYNYCIMQGLVPEARASAPPEGAARPVLDRVRASRRIALAGSWARPQL